jgi:uncharacterized membrane protein
MVLFVFTSVVIGGLAVPLVLRRVPPNDFYGFRVPKTLDDPAVWYPANAFTGYCLLAAATVLSAAALLLGLRHPELGVVRFTIVWTVVCVVMLTLAVGLSYLYLRSLPGEG